MIEPKQTLVDINRASLIELTSIRGIGPGLAARIVDERPYKNIEDLVRVPGINQTKLLTLKPFITLSAKKTQPAAKKSLPESEPEKPAQVTKFGETETFVFLENRDERQDALLMIFGGFILGLIILMLRRANR